MKNMRELINLMESVAAIPGLGESHVEEKAPPGMEDTVMDLKKQYPGEEDKAFATAWSIYNKKHGKTEEGIEDGAPTDDVPGDMNEPMEPSFDDVRVGQALDMFQNLVDSFVEPQEAFDQVMNSYREQGASEDELSSIEAAIMDQHGVDVVGDEPGDGMTDVEADADTLASAGWGTDEDYCDYGGGDEFEESVDLNNGYNDVKCAKGEDFFPDGADSPVVDDTGTSGARQGDNPEQKKIQVAEVHKELVYSYRSFLKESEAQKKN